MRSLKHVALSYVSIYYTWKNILKIIQNNKFKIAPTSNKEFELPDRSYFVPDVPDYFEYIFKKHGEKTNNLSIIIYLNKIEIRITFKIKTEYYVKIFLPETMILLGSNKSDITKMKW